MRVINGKSQNRHWFFCHCLSHSNFCCRASAGSRPYSWSIWDFWFYGSMVRWFDGHLWLQRCAVSGLLSCRACFSLRSNLLSCKISAEIVVYRMLAVVLYGLNGNNSSRRIVRNIFCKFIFFIQVSRLDIASVLLSHRFFWTFYLGNQDCKKVT